MPVFAYIALPVLAVIFWQDIRTRAIWWFLPPVLFVVLLLFRWEAMAFLNIVINAAFVIVLIGLLTLYIRLRFGKLENPFKNYFGLGDFLFLLALTPLFQLPEFVWFFTAGTICVLIVHLVVMLFRRSSTIPYAGYFSLFTASYLMINAACPLLFYSFNHPS